MKISELPFEILAQIADRLSTDDKRSCALACKGLRHTFQRALWRYIRVHSYRGVQKLIDNIKRHQTVSTPYSLWVYSLRIYSSYSIAETSDIEFSELFKYLPNLRCLDLGPISYERIYTDITSSDKIWTSLETLKIQWEGNSYIHQRINFFEFINGCSKLRKLEIRKGSMNQLLEFSMKDFDNMHRHLKTLSSITVHVNPTSDFWTTLDTIPSTAPAFSVTSLNINWKQQRDRNGSWNSWNPLWLYYFGYKYPNLRSLRLNSRTMWPSTLIMDKRETMISLFRSNPNAFQHLETFDFKHDIYFKLSRFILWEVFRELRVPLRHLTLDPTQLGELDASYSMDVNKVLESFSKTLQSFSVQGFECISGVPNPIFGLYSYHPLLTNLCISSIDVTLDIVNLLDKCVALKQLKFCAGTLVIDPNTTTETSKQQQHGLQILTLRKCSVAFEVFNYVSSRCRCLKQMTLYTLHIKGSICKITGCLLLDMPHTFLKTLNVGQLRYGPSYEETNVYDHSRLTLLSQLNDVSLTDEKTKRDTNEIDPEHPALTSQRIDWLYTYNASPHYKYKRVKTTKLSKSGANIAFEYYQRFQSEKVLQNLKHQCLCNREIDYMEREYELNKGYGQLKFGKVESSRVI